MSETTASLRRKLDSAAELQSVVRTMKALAASSISQYEQSTLALADYYHAVQLGLGACFRQSGRVLDPPAPPKRDGGEIGVVVFGSDQGLVGQFNEVIADFALKRLAALPGQPHVWAVGERLHARLAESGVPLRKLLRVPSSVQAITPLVGRILVESESHNRQEEGTELHLIYNRRTDGALYEPVEQRVLPLDDVWRGELTALPWPSASLPEVLGPGTPLALIREYLFISIFRVCAESLASENASRLAAMQRADTNIEDLLTELHSSFHRLRQSGIDEELFDVVAGFEGLKGERG